MVVLEVNAPVVNCSTWDLHIWAYDGSFTNDLISPRFTISAINTVSNLTLQTFDVP